METVVFTILGIVTIVVVVHNIIVMCYVYAVRTYRCPVVPDNELPKVAIVLSVRGVDPFFEDTLSKLMDQDYPCYEIHTISDSTNDPAGKMVWDAKQQNNGCKVNFNVLKNLRYNDHKVFLYILYEDNFWG